MNHTSKKLIKCRLDNFLMFFFTILRKSQYLREKKIAITMQEHLKRVPYNDLIKKLNICNIPLSESEEYDI